MHTPESWLAVGGLTETKRPHELPYVMAVMVNRARGGKTWPTDIVRVLRQAKQFSGFNAYSALPDNRCWEEIRKTLPDSLYAASLACATDILSRPVHLWPLDPGTYWFWSPQSMVPEGSVPLWAADLYSFTVPGVVPWRFVFACGVPRTHVLRGNALRDYDFRRM